MLGHEIGHVVHRHSQQRMVQGNLGRLLVQVLLAGQSGDPDGDGRSEGWGEVCNHHDRHDRPDCPDRPSHPSHPPHHTTPHPTTPYHTTPHHTTPYQGRWAPHAAGRGLLSSFIQPFKRGESQHTPHTPSHSLYTLHPPPRLLQPRPTQPITANHHHPSAHFTHHPPTPITIPSTKRTTLRSGLSCPLHRRPAVPLG